MYISDFFYIWKPNRIVTYLWNDPRTMKFSLFRCPSSTRLQHVLTNWMSNLLI